MSMSQDLEDEVIILCQELQINPDIGMNKYQEIYDHLKPLEQYKKDEHKLINDSVNRTKNWIRAHYNETKKTYNGEMKK